MRSSEWSEEKYPSVFIGSERKTVSSFTPGADSAGQFIWTGIQFNIYLTRLPFSEYLMQMNCSTVKMPDNCIPMFTF